MASSKRRKRGRKVLATVLIIFAVLIAVGAITVKLLKDRVTKAYGQKNTTEILSATVTRGSISTTISGNGVLPQQKAASVTVPSGVAVQSVRFEVGDTVKEGDKIASIHMPSVLTAINSLQETLDNLDQEIAEAAKETVDTYIKSTVKGRVKQIYCEKGDSVLSVMYAHNALMVLSMVGYLLPLFGYRGLYNRYSRTVAGTQNTARGGICT